MNNITIIVSIVLFSYLVSFIVGKIVVELLTKNNINQRLSIYLEERHKNYQLSLFTDERKKNEQERKVDDLFERFYTWVQDTLTIQNNPYIRVVTVIMGV